MRRGLLLVAISAMTAVAIWYGLKLASFSTAASVTALLPRGTVLLVHVPDFNATRDRWHQSDVYRLYQEPTVQDFLRKPLSRLPAKSTASEMLGQIKRVAPKDAFFALTRADQSSWTFVAGLEIRGNQHDAENLIDDWRGKLRGGARATVEYERHKIDRMALESFTLFSTYSGHWFFAANDLDELKALLDRADRRNRDRGNVLQTSEIYRAAMAHMPANYDALVYFEPRTFAQQLQQLRAAVGSTIVPGGQTIIEQIRSVCGTMRFEDGKIRDSIFVGIPRVENVPPINRSSLALGSGETFFYLATLLNIGDKLDTLSQAPGLSDRLQKLFQTFRDNGIKANDWKAAFGAELSLLADWAENKRWPSVVLSLPVLDGARAQKIVDVAMRADEDSAWLRTEKNGVRYFSMQSPATLISMAPAIALSDRMLMAGLDSGSVEEAVKRSQSSTSGLASLQTYKSGARAVPPPTNFFAYIDTALLYNRLDATLRPILLMAAAFAPHVNDSVDLAKIPEAQVITRHLSPIVDSQRYDRDGYVAESVGPITFNGATIGLAALAFAGANNPIARSLFGLPFAAPTPTPSGTP
jgi:hypothetical protein